MLFNLNKFKVTPEGFTLLYYILDACYYDKMINTTHGKLEEATGMSKYKVRAALDELRRDKLIQTKSFTTGIKITLMPVLIDMINKDLYRPERSSQRSKALTEIKKSQGTKKPEGSPLQNSPTLLTETSTPKPRPIISGHSAKNTSVAEPPVKPTKKTNPPNQAPKPTNTRKNTVPRGSVKKPYITTRGKLYIYFDQWLRLYEAMNNDQVNQLLRIESDLEKFWNRFKAHAVNWLKLQKVTTKPETDLNKIKFMRQIALAA
jgi:hypothetical protein